MKLRWVTLGYHYDWDNKKYYPNRYNKFPDDLSDLCKYIASVVGYQTFSPEAGIVNYYHMDSTLAGHTDHSELDHDAPLISISFGQDAIFLIGGITKETKPSAVMLHSGDICVMSGQSRLVYHAVPRILHSDKLDSCIFSHKPGVKSSNDTADVESSDNTTDFKSSDNATDLELLDNAADVKPSDSTADIKSCDSTFQHKSCDNIADVKSCDKTSYIQSCDNSAVVKLPITSNVFDKVDTDLKSCHRKTNCGERGDRQIEEELLFREYLNCTRININVRQVLKQNEIFPECSKTEFNNKRLKLE